MLDLGALKLAVKADTSEATQQLTEFGNKSVDSGGKFTDFISNAKKLVVGGAIAAGIGKAVGAMKNMVNSSLEATDTVDKMSQKIGISKTAYQEWNHVCSQSGVDVGVFKNGIKTLVGQMDAAQRGTASAQGAFKTLGLTWEDGTGKLKDQETMMNEAVSALAGMQDGSERAKLATELFGKAGTELAPILNSGTEGIQGLKDEAHNLGLVMSDETINAGVKLEDTIANLKDSLGMVGTSLATKLYPVIQQVADWVTAHMPQIQATVQTVFDAVGSCINIISPLISAIGQVISNVVTQAQTDGTAFNIIWTTIQTAVQTATDIIKSVIKLFSSALQGDWTGCWNSIVDIVKNIGSLLQTAGKAVFDLLWTGIKGVWSSITSWVSTSFNNIVTKIKGFGTNFLNAGKHLFTELWNGLKSVWTSIWTWVSEKVQAIIDAFTSAFSFGGGKDDSKSSSKKSGHRNGLDTVPYDGYQTVLQKGEMELTAAEADRYRNSFTDLANILTTATSLNNANGNSGIINLTVQLGTDNFGNAVVKYGDEARNRLGNNKVVTV